MTFDECDNFEQIKEECADIVESYKKNMFPKVKDMTLIKESLKLELEYFLNPKQSEGRKNV